jgi:hypothetical protein
MEGKNNDKAQRKIYQKNSEKYDWFRFAFSFEKIFKIWRHRTQSRLLPTYFFFLKMAKMMAGWKVNGIVYSTLRITGSKFLNTYRIHVSLENQPISHVKYCQFNGIISNWISEELRLKLHFALGKMYLNLDRI